MKIKRKEFLDTLKTVIRGTHKIEVLEQSHCFVFTEKGITAFNGEIYATAKFDSPGNFAVPAHDLLQLVSKFPDEEIELSLKKQQLVVTGKKKRFGLTIQDKILLPIEDIPKHGKMVKVMEGVMEAIIMGAKICAPNSEDYRHSHVHVSPEKIQATDRFRFLRITLKTGMKNVLVPAGAILSLADIPVDRMKLEKGWLFLGNKNVMLAVCCSEEEYYADAEIDSIMVLDDPKPVQLPKEMKNVLDRALIMTEDDSNRMAKISLTKKYIAVRTQKESGWYEERQPVKYKGDDMNIIVGLSLFKDLLTKTHKALVTQERIKMEKDGIEFVVALGE